MDSKNKQQQRLQQLLLKQRAQRKPSNLSLLPTSKLWQGMFLDAILEVYNTEYSNQFTFEIHSYDLSCGGTVTVPHRPKETTEVDKIIASISEFYMAQIVEDFHDSKSTIH